MNDHINFLNPLQYELAAATPQTAQVKEEPWYSNYGRQYVEMVEKFSTKAYRDSKGIPTIGHGFIVHPETGRKVRMGDTISRAASEKALRANMEKFDKAMGDKYKTWNTLGLTGKTALYSLMHNQTNEYGNLNAFPRLHGIMSMEVADEPQLNEFHDKLTSEIRHWGDTKDPELIPRRRSEVWLMNTGEMKDQGWFLNSDEAKK